MTAALAACFFVSGAAALALEMLWMRSAALALGGTAVTNASVLACYFAGLAAGSLMASGGSDRPVRRYGWLELGVAAGAMWSFAAFALLTGEWGRRAIAGRSTIVHLLAVAAATLPAAVCLGATLPSLGHALARGAVGRRGGLLYALNTLGGAIGAAAAGFGLPAAIGVRASYAVAVAASAAAGMTALRVGDRGFTSRAHRTDGAPARRTPLRLVAVAAVSGALGLGLEVLWIRVFAQVLHNSIYSFTAVALVFLVAIAAGAALSALCLARFPAGRIAATSLVVAGAATVAGYWAFLWMTDGLAYQGMRSGLVEYVARIVALAAVTAGPAAVAGAVALPALWHAFGAAEGAARPLGRVAAANAAGAAMGAVLTGFVVVPALGVRGGILLVAVAFVLLADLAQRPTARSRAVAAAVLVGLVVADPLRAPLTRLRDATEIVRATHEGPSGIVTVVDRGGDVQLRLDSFYTLGGSGSAANERRQGLIPLLLHPHPERVAFIGLATGITASVAPALGVRETTVVELVPEVAHAARTYFDAWNGKLLERPDVRLVVDDGRRFLAVTDDRFDVIVSDLFIPWHAGTGSLYARETYEAAARDLAPGGLFCQWLPLYQLTREEFDVIAHTFLAVFPDATLWRADFYADRPVVGLVGGRGTRTVDLDRLQARISGVPDTVADAAVGSPRALAMLHGGDLGAAAALFAAAPLNTDDRPMIEFLAPRMTRMSEAGDKDWFTGESLAAFYDTLEGWPSSTTSLLPASEDLASARRAGLALFRYAVATARHDDRAAAAEEARVRELVPDVIADAEVVHEMLPFVDPAKALGALHAEQAELRRQMTDMERELAGLTGGHE